jgi:hypothetical protein
MVPRLKVLNFGGEKLNLELELISSFWKIGNPNWNSNLVAKYFNASFDYIYIAIDFEAKIYYFLDKVELHYSSYLGNQF